MAKDNRKKGCPNKDCEMNTKKILQKADVNYCPKCGTKLVFVCKNCFTEIESTDFKNCMCVSCAEKSKENKQQMKSDIKNGAEKAGKVVGKAATKVVKGVASKVVSDGQRNLVKKCVNIIEEKAKSLLKKS